KKILYQGDAISSVGAIELTKNNEYLTDFSTKFSFQIDTLGRPTYGHGLVFFLATVGLQIPLNSAGGILGLLNTTASFSSTNHIASEDFHRQDTADVQIAYNSTTKNLSVSWTYRLISDPRENTSLFYIIDLMKVLSQWVTIGFSAATGHCSDNGTVDFAEAEEGKKSAAERETLTSINDDLERGAVPRRFFYRDLASATSNFPENKMGYLIDLDMAAAVKNVSRGSKQGKKEYVTEVKTISQLRHRNLVQLLGCCHDRGEFLLVYEFMPNGSLDARLFGKKRPLAWAVRYMISLGLATALLYLYEEWEQCVVHRDTKSSNIMLDVDVEIWTS
ncbi:hypothetical protein CISIN_1g040174mg, partial [Citrus sinensis]